MSRRIAFTWHSKMRMLQRGINEETVRGIILNPEHRIEGFLSRSIAVKKIGEKLWHVAYLTEENNIKVVTVYYEWDENRARQGFECSIPVRKR